MGILIFAILGAVIAYFGGVSFGMYEGYGVSAPFIGAAIGAVAAALIGLALKPRKGPKYQGPQLD